MNKSKDLTAAQLAELLSQLGACSEAREWAVNRTLKQAWAECERGDWMLWLAARVGVDRRAIVCAACDCAETAWEHCADGATLTAAILAVHIAREWASGHEEIETVYAVAAVDAVYAAYAAADAADAAAYAVYAAAADAADAAAYAVYAADAAADAASSASARRASLHASAKLVRARIPYSAINPK